MQMTTNRRNETENGWDLGARVRLARDPNMTGEIVEIFGDRGIMIRWRDGLKSITDPLSGNVELSAQVVRCPE